MPQPSAEATQNTPLAPSVEKAYYRKCIELKRRLNEVERANDEARLRRHRLHRAVLKMRLERAMMLDQLAARIESGGLSGGTTTAAAGSGDGKGAGTSAGKTATTPARGSEGKAARGKNDDGDEDDDADDDADDDGARAEDERTSTEGLEKAATDRNESSHRSGEANGTTVAAEGEAEDVDMDAQT